MIKTEKGSSLVEVLLVVVVLGLIVILMGNLPSAMTLINKSKHLGLAREIATKQIEDKRQAVFSSLTNGSVSITDPRISQLPGSSGTVNVLDCDVSICTNSENVKQVTVTINWFEGSKGQQIIVKTLVGQDGLN